MTYKLPAIFESVASPSSGSSYQSPSYNSGYKLPPIFSGSLTNNISSSQITKAASNAASAQAAILNMMQKTAQSNINNLLANMPKISAPSFSGANIQQSAIQAGQRQLTLKGNIADITKTTLPEKYANELTKALGSVVDVKKTYNVSAIETVNKLSADAIKQILTAKTTIELGQIKQITSNALYSVEQARDIGLKKITELENTLKTHALTALAMNKTKLAEITPRQVRSTGIQIGNVTFKPSEIVNNVALRTQLLNTNAITMDDVYKAATTNMYAYAKKIANDGRSRDAQIDDVLKTFGVDKESNLTSILDRELTIASGGKANISGKEQEVLMRQEAVILDGKVLETMLGQRSRSTGQERAISERKEAQATKEAQLAQNELMKEKMAQMAAAVKAGGASIGFAGIKLTTKGTLEVNGKEITLQTVKPETYDNTKSWTKPLTDYANSMEPGIAKSSLSMLANLMTSKNTALANEGLVKKEYVAGTYKENDWSMGKALQTLGRAVISGYNHIANDTDLMSLDMAYTGNEKITTLAKGYETANKLGNALAKNGDMGYTGTLNKNNMLGFVLENADVSTLDAIKTNQPHVLAKAAYNPMTAHSVIDAYGTEETQKIRNGNPLTIKEMNEVNRDVVVMGIESLADAEVTGTPLDLVLLVAGGGFLNELEVAGKVAGRATKVAYKVSDAVSGASDFATFVKNAGIKIPSDNGILSISDIAFKNVPSAKVSVVTTPSTGSIAKAIGRGSNENDITKIIQKGASIEDKAIAIKTKEINNAIDTANKETKYANSYVTKVATEDQATVKAAFVEAIANGDGPRVYAGISRGSVGADNAHAQEAFRRLEEAKDAYGDLSKQFAVKVAQKGNARDGAKILEEYANTIGERATKNLVETAQNAGSEHYSALSNAMEEYEASKIAKLPTIGTKRTGATRAISSMEKDITTVMPESVATRLNRISHRVNVGDVLQNSGKMVDGGQVRRIERIEDVAALSDEEISALSKANIGIKEQDLKNYRKAARDVLSKDVDENLDEITTAMKSDEFGETSWSLEKKRQEWDDAYKEVEETLKTTKKNAPKFTSSSRVETIEQLKKKRDVESNKLSEMIKEHANAAKNGIKGEEEYVEIMETAIKSQRDIVKEYSGAIDDLTEVLDEPQKLIKGSKKPTDAARSSISEIKTGKFSDAAEKLAEASSHKRTPLLSGRNLDEYKGVTIPELERLKRENAPEELVKQMMRERSEYALQELAKKGQEYKKIAFKISDGDELTEAERLKAWNGGDEIRELTRDASHTDKGNLLLKGLTDDAVKSKDATRMKTLAREMKEELNKCIKKGVC